MVRLSATIQAAMPDRWFTPALSREVDARSIACVDSLSFLDEGLGPGHNPYPTLTVALGLLRVASEPAVANLHQRAGASALRTARVQAMHALGFEFPANGGFQIARVTGDPGLDQEARRINFEVLAADLEGVAVGADARAFPFAVDTQVGFEIGDAGHPPPPAPF